VPSQSVEAATRDQAIAAAREKFGPTARVVGVRRIRSGGMFGFFTNERYIAEVEISKPAPAGGPDSGSLLKVGPREERPASSMDDRMRELAELLGSAQESPSVGLYARSGATAAAPAAARATARPAGRSAAPASGRFAAPASALSSGRPGATPRNDRTATASRAASPKPFTPAKHTLMLPAEDLAPAPAASPEPVVQKPASPSPFAAALTRMVASHPVQAAADAAVEAAAVEAAAVEAAAVEAAAVEAGAAESAAADAAAAQTAAIEAEAAEVARAAGARIDAAAAEAARVRAETATAEAARLRAAAAAAEAARLQAQAAAAEAARIEAEAAAAEVARIEAERIDAERIEAERIEAERIEAEAAAAEAARIEAERVEAARVEAARQPAADPGDVAPRSMVESVRTADEDLAALLEEVLAANGSGRGRHRLPEAGSRVLDVPEPWAYENHAPGSNAYDTGSGRTDAHAGPAWASDARVAQRAAQVAAAQSLVVDAVVVAETPAEEVRHVEASPVEVPSAVPVEEERFAVPVSLAPALSSALSSAMARTASDPAPLPVDATMMLPALSLMPPRRFGGMPLLPGRPAVPPARRGRPPVPSGRSQAVTRPVPIPVPITALPAAAALPAAEESSGRLATVTRLVPASSSTAPAPFAMNGPEELVVRLLTLGLPDFLLGHDFTVDATNRGVYAALTRTLAERLPLAPLLPRAPGDVLMVVGPGPETFAAARALAVSLHLEPEDVQWAASGALAGLAPEGGRITSLETAVERQQISTTTGAVTVVAVDAPLRTSGGPWLEHMLSVWSPTAVWGVLDSTRKPEDLVPWLDGLPRLDAVVVQDTDATADPAAVLSHVTVPVALVDGVRATAHRWASLLCERLEEMDR
jgi:hypothetical protein